MMTPEKLLKATLQNLPCDWDAERFYLSCLLQDNAILGREPAVTPEDFHFTGNRELYEEMLSLWEDRRLFDWVILADHLRNRNPKLLADQCGGEGLEDLSMVVISAVNAPHYARILKEKNVQRRLMLWGADLQKAGQVGDFERAEAIARKISAERMERDDSGRWIDAATICHEPLEPFEWLVNGLFPRSGAGTMDGPPDSGKSSLALSLAICIANGGGSWFGQEATGGPVVVLGGEKSSRKVWRRDFERLGKVNRPGMFFIPELRDPLWEWSKQTGKWIRSKAYSEALKGIKRIKPVMVIGDTIMRITAGIEELNNTQQAYLGREMEEFSRELGCLFLVIGHTNQSSARESLNWRLHYTARSGGNGLPGVMRYCFAVTRLHEHDSKTTGIPEDSLNFRRLLACGVSKGNELPWRAWSETNPAFFEIRPDGQLAKIDRKSVKTGGEGAERLKYEEVSVGYQDPLADWR